jgi:signal transduction histidine kinase
MALEATITTLSSQLLAAQPAEVAAVVRDGLAAIGGQLGIDRAYVVKTDTASPGIDLYEQWWADGIPPVTTPLEQLPREAQRFWARSLRNLVVVHYPDLVAVPPEAREAAAALEADGVCSILFLPLQLRDLPCGFVGFETRTRRYTFPPESVALMRTVGELIVSAVERSKVEATLASTAAELEARNADLERSNEDLEQFASIVSHDLKSPLQVVRGFVELLGRVARDGPRSEEAQTYQEAAIRGAERMNTLIEDLLSYAKAGRAPEALVAVDLATIAEQVVADSAEAIAAAGARVHIGVLPPVLGDRTQLRQLLQNLLSNAVKFREPDREPVVTITAERDDPRWRIVVADNGIGVSAEDAARIFGMFTRLHGSDRYPGSGIGLAVCARVVSHHGGTMWVEPNPGGGSRFVFTLDAV